MISHGTPFYALLFYKVDVNLFGQYSMRYSTEIQFCILLCFIGKYQRVVLMMANMF